MEISLDKVKSRSDPYQLFLDSIRSPATLRRYKNQLHVFLKLIPNQIYVDSLDKTPNDREVTTLAKFFVQLAKKDTDLASDIIATFIKEDKKRVISGDSVQWVLEGTRDIEIPIRHEKRNRGYLIIMLVSVILSGSFEFVEKSITPFVMLTVLFISSIPFLYLILCCIEEK